MTKSNKKKESNRRWRLANKEILNQKKREYYLARRFSEKYELKKKLRIRTFICPYCSKEIKNKAKFLHFMRNHKLKEYEYSRNKYNHSLSLSKMAINNPQWRGDEVSYGALHDYIKSYLLKPTECERCGCSEFIELCNKSGFYLRDFSDWEWLCRKCHMIKDGRFLRLKNGLRNERHKQTPSI